MEANLIRSSWSMRRNVPVIALLGCLWTWPPKLLLTIDNGWHWLWLGSPRWLGKPNIWAAVVRWQTNHKYSFVNIWHRRNTVFIVALINCRMWRLLTCHCCAWHSFTSTENAVVFSVSAVLRAVEMNRIEALLPIHDTSENNASSGQVTRAKDFCCHFRSA